MRTLIEMKTSYYYLLLIIIILVVLLIMLIMLIVYHVKEKKNLVTMRNQSNSVRVFVIDYKRRSVRYFNRSNLKKQKVISFQKFLNQFPLEEQTKIQKWIEDLSAGKEEVPMYMECDVIINKDKKSFFSFLQVQKRDKKTQIIHLESYLMKYLVAKGHFVRKSRQMSLNNSQLQNLYNGIKRKNKGACFAIKLFHSHIQGEVNKKVDNLLVTQLKNNLINFLNSNRYIVQIDSSLLVIYDFKIDSRRDMMQLAHSLSKVIHKYIDINSFRENYDFSIGICEFSYGDGFLKNVLGKANAAAIVAHSKEGNNDITMYAPELQLEKTNEEAFEIEIQNIINNKEIDYLFRPIVNSKQQTIYGYFCNFQSLNQFFPNMRDIKEYAYRLNQGKDLFSLITKNIIPKFISERDGESIRLFYRITVSEMEYVLKSFAHINGIKESKIVLVLEDEDLFYWHMDVQQLKEYADSYQKRGIELALCIKDKDLILPQEMLCLFDEFIFDEKLTRGLKHDNRLRLTIHGLYERLEVLHRPIIATDMNSWNGVELMIKTGISYVSSDMISPWDEMLLPVDKKKMVKLKSLAGSSKN